MKKFFFLAVSLIAALGFTGCKFEQTKVTIYVQDKDNTPVANVPVYAIDLASAIIDFVAPDPTAVLTGDDGDLSDYKLGKTNDFGAITVTWNMGVKSMDYLIYVPDASRNDWAVEKVKVQRGQENEFTITLGKDNENTAKVTVVVTDRNSKPVKDRPIYAIDMTTAIIDIVTPPDPADALVDKDGKEYTNVKTNADGEAVFNLYTAKTLKYYFYIPDLGAEKWIVKELDVKKGEDQILPVEVNE